MLKTLKKIHNPIGVITTSIRGQKYYIRGKIEENGTLKQITSTQIVEIDKENRLIHTRSSIYKV